MRPVRSVLAPVLAAAATACVVSSAPVVPEGGGETDPRLLGEWAEVGGTDTVVVTEGDDGTYRIRHTDGRGQQRYVARLGRLGQRRILDVQQVSAEEMEAHPKPDDFLPGHLLVVLELTGPDEVRVATLERDSMVAALEDGSLALSATEEGDHLLLGGGTAALRSALAPYLERPGSLSEPETWRRVSSPRESPSRSWM